MAAFEVKSCPTSIIMLANCMLVSITKIANDKSPLPSGRAVNCLNEDK